MHARRAIGSLKVPRTGVMHLLLETVYTSRFRASCAASHLQSNYYIPEICIREMIQHIYGGLLLVAVVKYLSTCKY